MPDQNLWAAHVIVAAFLTIATSPPAAAADPSPARNAERFTDSLAAGDFATCHATFDETVARQLSAEQLKSTWAALQQQVGKFVKRHGTRAEHRPPFTVTHVTCEFTGAWIDTRVVFNQAGRVAGLQFLPARRPDQQTPPYAKPETFTEVPVEFGDPDWRLPGTLSQPKGDGQFPAIILVHGSGPNDRDETIGANKPFRDLAWGLATRGIAVLRYDKRTYAHQAKLAKPLAGFTTRQEVTDDVGHALAFLRQRNDINPQRIYVLGHSLGGTLAPRIARDHPGLAGLAILAGATRPLEDMMVEQVEYLARLDGNVSDDETRKLDELRSVAARVKALTANDATDPTPIVGAAASYWLDLRTYDAPLTAAGLTLPILVLQGGRDYQVTTNDLAIWQKALNHQPNVRFKTYPDLNHLFISGQGKPSPAEYQIPGFVSEDVIRDLAELLILKK